MLTVQRASFHRRADGVLAVVGAGTFPRRALPLVARVGEVDVQAISVSPDGRRFMGLLRRPPRAGDELVVRFLPEPPTRTGIRFPSNLGGPTRVASADTEEEAAEDDPRVGGGPAAILKRYVSPSGKDTNDGSKGKPYRHVQYGIDRLAAEVRAGRARQAALLLAAGVYEEDLVLASHVHLYREDEAVPFTLDLDKGTSTPTRTGHAVIARKTDGGALITIKDATDVTIRGLKLEGHTKGTSRWKLGGRGIVIRNSQNVTIHGCLIWNNWSSVVYKGREAGTEKDPYLGDSLVSDSSSGAGILVESSKTLDIASNFFSNNRCDAKWAVKSPFDLPAIPATASVTLSQEGESVTFTRKCLARYLTENPEIYRNGGGGVSCAGSTGIAVTGNLFTNNHAARGGAVRFGNKAYGSIVDNHIASNVAWVDGGGIAIWDYDRATPITRQPILIRGNSILENSANDDGGGAYLSAKTLATLEDNRFQKNVANGNGGGLRVSFGSEVSVATTLFLGNRANAGAAGQQPDKKDGGGAAAIQNATVSFEHCTFKGNEVLGFAGGAIYCNTVGYETVGEKLGKAFFGEGFDEILRDKYKFTEARLTVTNCSFADNRCHGKTCYGKATSTSDKLAVVDAARAGCDTFLDAYAKYRARKQCDASGGGRVSGTAGGAMYVLQKKDGLPLLVAIRKSSFENDASEHDDPALRAAVFIRDCREVELAGESIKISAPTRLKLHLRDVTLVNAAASTLLTCSGGKAKTADAQVFLQDVACR